MISVDPVEHPPRRRDRGDHPEQLLPVAEHRDPADRVRAVGDRHRQIGEDPPGACNGTGRDRFVDAGKAGMDRSLPGPDGGQSQTERRLRHECEQLKLALAEATVQLRIWQKGSEFVDAVPSPTSRP